MRADPGVNFRQHDSSGYTPRVRQKKAGAENNNVEDGLDGLREFQGDHIGKQRCPQESEQADCDTCPTGLRGGPETYRGRSGRVKY